ncbi:hypothetical protein B0H13DRAFT_2345497 [Mycena leptocephala]|nr:hypothetical protein B0H13DRAFT_2345497 [Mycena leptocephala]
MHPISPVLNRGFEISTSRRRGGDPKIYIAPWRARPKSRPAAAPHFIQPDQVGVNQEIEALDVQMDLRSLIQATAWLCPDVQSHRSETVDTLDGFQAHLVALASSVAEKPWAAGQKSSQLDLIMDVRAVSTLLRRRRRSPSQRLRSLSCCGQTPAYASAAAGEHRLMPTVALSAPVSSLRYLGRSPVPAADVHTPAPAPVIGSLWLSLQLGKPS